MVFQLGMSESIGVSVYQEGYYKQQSSMTDYEIDVETEKIIQ